MASLTDAAAGAAPEERPSSLAHGEPSARAVLGASRELGVPSETAPETAVHASAVEKAAEEEAATTGEQATKNLARGPDRLASAFAHSLSLATRGVHADDYINNHRAVAPPLHVSTTFRYNDDPDKLTLWENIDPNAPYDSHMYSRDSGPNSTRLEALLSSLLGGPAVTYASGIAAFHALLVFLNPRAIALSDGYHGSHGVVALLGKLTGLRKLDLGSEHDLAHLQPGDVIHVETPLNPTGEARDLARWRDVARAKECYLTVDATFAPPPLQDPLGLGADAVMHSATKYLGGHSDLLCGVLAVRRDRADRDGWVKGLLAERVFLGSVAGSLEGWLGVRSLRTLEMRVLAQSRSAEVLVRWLAGETGQQLGASQTAGESGGGGGGGAAAATAAEAAGTEAPSSASSPSPASRLVSKVYHASLQPEAADPESWLRCQMPRGFGAVFAVRMRNERAARRLPSKLHLFAHATSLGGVESLIEWRAMTDRTVDRRLLRVSVGVESVEDLRADLEQGLAALLAEEDDADGGQE